MPEDARVHIIGETGQAGLGTLSQAKQGSQKDRRGGFARSSIAGKARRRGAGLPGKRHRRAWTARGLGATRRFKPRIAEGWMHQGNLEHHRWHGLWTGGTGQPETSSPARRNSAGTGQPGRRRRKPSWNKQETGQPGDCEKAEGLMHVSMSYKGIRKRPEAQASGLFDLWSIAGGDDSHPNRIGRG